MRCDACGKEPTTFDQRAHGDECPVLFREAAVKVVKDLVDAHDAFYADAPIEEGPERDEAFNLLVDKVMASKRWLKALQT